MFHGGKYTKTARTSRAGGDVSMARIFLFVSIYLRKGFDRWKLLTTAGFEMVVGHGGGVFMHVFLTFVMDDKDPTGVA